MITLTDSQLQDTLNLKATAENGMNEILKMILNAIMYSERAEFLKTKNKSNKANGFRPVQVHGYGKQLFTFAA